MSNAPVPRRIKRGWMNLKVTRIVDETPDTKTLFFEDADESGRPWDYVAGQYLTFRFDELAEKPVVRSYTMSSSPRDRDTFAVTVKRVEGGLISNWFCDKVAKGDVLRARGPIGKFVYDLEKDRRELMMIGAGSGVTPFVSILREYHDQLGKPGGPERLGLLVAYRSREDLILWEDLTRIARSEGVRVVTTLTRDVGAGGEFWHGRPDTSMLERFIGDAYGRTTFMTCGPEGMMDAVKNLLVSRQVPPEHIKTESFFS
jgi:ferredoxin-NADP reductase